MRKRLGRFLGREARGQTSCAPREPFVTLEVLIAIVLDGILIAALSWYLLR